MSPPVMQGPEPLDEMARRQRWLLVLAWGATLLPLIAFGYLTWQSWVLSRQVEEARQSVAREQAQLVDVERRKAELESEIRKLSVAVESQRASAKHYRDVTGIRIRFYRESDRAVVNKALEGLGFRVDAELGSSRLINVSPNTLAYGPLVSAEDLREIGVALLEAAFPLKRIVPAVRQQDPKLVQVYASAETDASCGVLTVEQVRAGQNCGNRP